MAAYKKIQGNPIKPGAKKPTGSYGPHGVSSHPKAVGNVKGGPNLSQGGGHDYFNGTGARGSVSIRGGQK